MPKTYVDWNMVFKSFNTIKNIYSFLNSNKLRKENNDIHYPSFLADNLRKYSEQFSRMRKETEPELRKISSNASIIYSDVLNKIDLYDNSRVHNKAFQPHSEEYLRHIADRIVKLWYHNYSHRLGRNWSGLCFSSMREILHVKPEEENINVGTKNRIIKGAIEKLNFFAINRSEPLESANSHPELFNSLLSAYFDRVSNPNELYDESIKLTRPVFDEILFLQDLLEKNCATIEQWIEDNKLEEAKINESPELYEPLIKYKACMMFLSQFFLFDFDLQCEKEHLKINQVLEILLCLFILQTYGLWGDSTLFPV